MRSGYGPYWNDAASNTGRNIFGIYAILLVMNLFAWVAVGFTFSLGDSTIVAIGSP